MADSSALRARRSRRHASGDHSLCRPERCAEAVVDDTPSVPLAPDSPGGLRERGQRLWNAMTAAGSLGPMQSVLLLEACRIADRLDTLDRQLRGDAWLRFRLDESGVEVTVYVDRVLAEAREQATALKGIVTELAKLAGQSRPVPAKKGGGVLADLAARRAARGSLPAG